MIDIPAAPLAHPAPLAPGAPLAPSAPESASAEAWFTRGTDRAQGRHWREAVQAFDHAIALRPAFAEAHANKGITLALQAYAERVGATVWHEAVACFDRALALNPGLEVAHRQRAIVRQDLGDHAGAISDFERAIALVPERLPTRLMLGQALIRTGHWERGWQEHEFRLAGTVLRPRVPVGRARRWRGESLAGRSILLHAEQGLGDSIQFFRFVDAVQAEAARTTVWVPPALRNVLGPGSRHEEIGMRSDFHASWMSLPAILGTRPDTVPAPHGYLQADPVRVAAWRDRLGPASRLRVGLAWSGSPTHPHDVHRSMTLADLAPLLAEDAEFVCLQTEVRDIDRPGLGVLRSFGADISDFADTTALCELMDLVISVDTSVAHLAGAMGKPLRILLPANADWRWMTGREDTPWYASARLVRQPAIGHWPAVVARVCQEVREKASARSGAIAREAAAGR